MEVDPNTVPLEPPKEAKYYGAHNSSAANPDQREFVVDFRGASPPPSDVDVSVTSSGGKILSPRGAVVPETGVYRVGFELAPERENVVELRLVLTSQNQPWGETWLYRWTR